MRLTRKVVVLAGLVAAIAVAALLVQHFAFAQQPPAFRFATVERGDIRAVVSATGTLNAVTTVSVGTQVSGQVAALFVDFNDHVKKGQLLARIDPTIAQQGVADAQANLEKLQAQANQASRDQTRAVELSSAGADRDQRARTGRRGTAGREGQREIRPHRPPARAAEPLVHLDLRAHRRCRRRAQRQQRTDGRRQPLSTAALPDRERSRAHADPGARSARATSTRSSKASR